MDDGEPCDLRDVLERAHSKIAAGEPVEWHTDEVELHAPVQRRGHEPVKVDPGAEAALRQRLGPNPAE